MTSNRLVLIVFLACAPREVPVITPAPALAVAPPSTPADAERLDALSKEHEAKNDFQAALDDALAALAVRERILPQGHIDIARTRLRIARVYWMLGRYPEIETLIDAAFDTLEKELGADHPDVGRALALRATVILHDRQYKNARPIVLRAIAIFEHTPGAEEDLYEVLCNLGVSYYGAWEWPDATKTYERATKLGEKVYGKNDWHLAWAVGGMGEVIRMQGRTQEALPYLERDVELQEKSPYKRQLASALNNLANIYSYTNHDYARAEPMYRRAIAISEGVYGGDDINTAQDSSSKSPSCSRR